MKLVATLLVCCLVVAAAKASIAILFAACILSLVWGAMFRPAQTFGFIGLCLLSALLQRYPGWCLAMAAIGLIIATTGRRSKCRRQIDQT